MIIPDRFGLRGSDVHVVGHSLGAHLVGKIARVFHEVSGQQVSRVTGNSILVVNSQSILLLGVGDYALS